MITVRLNGGLGNQMFQYATGRAIADRIGIDLSVNLDELSNETGSVHTQRHYELSKLNVRTDSVSNNGKIPAQSLLSKTFFRIREFTGKVLDQRIVAEKFFYFDPAILEISSSCVLTGYWQSEKYFQSSRRKIIEDFRPREVMNSVNRDTAESIASTNSVSIHVRRGDYVTNSQANKFHGLCGLDYYQKAIKFIQNRASNTHFFIFSDEIDWVKENLNTDSPTTYISDNAGDESYWDMQLMKECKHHIIANSSFSWWGAWLSENDDGIVIAPEKWFSDPKINTNDLIPLRWIRL